ncbi:MAG: DUF3783 domain-containing protein [Lachnospiraceae bacterium]|nr:DUF3783 domain-containing protein [Lachnospiraceae bacterium]
MKKTILLVGFSEEEKRALKRTILPLGYRILEATDQDTGKTLGAILGLNEESDVPEPMDVSVERFLLMAGLDRKDLDLFLSVLRKNKIPPIPYKAMLTPTNAGWKLGDLYQEIVKEHAYMHSGKGEKS